LPLAGEHDALTVAIKGTLTPPKAPPPKWSSSQEPKWFSPRDLAKIVTKAQITNHVALATYLMSAPVGLDHLRTARNCYAHRSLELRIQVLALGPSYLIGGARHPWQVLLHTPPGRTVTVLERWLLDIRRLSSALCA
jgi:hypothetical protein